MREVRAMVMPEGESEPRNAREPEMPNAAAPAVVPRMARPEIHAAAPALGWYTDHVLYHEVWNRAGLSRRDRSLVTVAALITGGRMAQLKGHIGRGLSNGVSPTEIVEVVTHLAFFAGWPNAMSAVPVMTQVFDEREVRVKDLQRTDTAPATSPNPVRPPSEPLLRAGGPFSATMRACTSRPVVDELWNRTELAVRDRSLVTFASVVALGEFGDLAVYARRAREDGVQVGELCEAVAHLAFYVGWARACAAATVLDGGLTISTGV